MDLKELTDSAALAKLALGEGELESFAASVDRILGYFAKMMELDVEALPPTTHAFQKENVTRPDTPWEDREAARRLADQLLEEAPGREDRFFTIPGVL
ncbi:MAG: Asp-tRNA(Asn)/Glu-tRNA(Gln) amidotransferase subunit GatC [Spirochaetales bacterium]|jgi:aspartyl-tRNA(Asn)/glutamyl-tRNA(Gln) amidotransferase subunit C|nr:Asp-tRNA(Asn)/Glu-tRNA(Gln) amidotransferase subunit GatC [Spirochaetales bacterium]